ncbi:hypothetical protein I553_8328 [Mycobacterium xenopi 4042]|uniref:Uncharacterized protein n=1 Tax=Mycobacterium xenopi 4042 TaxID=1299334 RepID=X8BJE4_MYCXE|nr:hypothetical protein I552_7997 [Mycobacterium xenopi 3993]EUA43994.1 hypothetical protein I553_8328 [Mycobacterium xenopi 4042]
MATVRFKLDHALAAELEQRFAHRRDADTELGGRFVEPDERPGRSVPDMIAARRCPATSSDNCARRTGRQLRGWRTRDAATDAESGAFTCVSSACLRDGQAIM